MTSTENLLDAHTFSLDFQGNTYSVTSITQAHTTKLIVATINILLLAVGGDPVAAAFYCFLFSVVFLLGSVLALLHLKRTPLYRQCVRTGPAAQPELPGANSNMLSFFLGFLAGALAASLSLASAGGGGGDTRMEARGHMK